MREYNFYDWESEHSGKIITKQYRRATTAAILLRRRLAGTPNRKSTDSAVIPLLKKNIGIGYQKVNGKTRLSVKIKESVDLSH